VHNNFGTCLEQRFKVQANREDANEYYERSAKQGHPDGANNLGLCVEHSRDVARDIEVGAECHKKAADRDHSEVALNYRRGLCCLGP
jgi:TPR repeat protein